MKTGLVLEGGAMRATYTIGVLVGNGLQLLICFGAYVGSFRLYVKRHPVILKAMAASDEDDEEDEDGPYDEEV